MLEVYNIVKVNERNKTKIFNWDQIPWHYLTSNTSGSN